MSAAKAFLHPARKRGNVDVRTHAHVTNIIFEGKRAVGVRYLKGGKGGTPVEVRASKEVILSGGTYNSPQVLQLSGVGSPELLQSHGIEVRHALPGVGEGLQDHYAPRSVARVKNIRTINELRRGLSLWVEALKWATTRRGLLSLSPTMVYCFWHSGETTESSDLQLTFTPASYKEGVQGQLEDEPGMTVASWQQRPESRGYVRIRSADPFAPMIAGVRGGYCFEQNMLFRAGLRSLGFTITSLQARVVRGLAVDAPRPTLAHGSAGGFAGRAIIWPMSASAIWRRRRRLALSPISNRTRPMNRCASSGWAMS